MSSIYVEMVCVYSTILDLYSVLGVKCLISDISLGSLSDSLISYIPSYLRLDLYAGHISSRYEVHYNA